jgi:hypothetical protein
MFGVSLRSYRRRVQRMKESSTVRGRTLWEAVLGYLEENSLVTRQQVLDRFRRDDEENVRGILHDLTESGIVFCTGSGPDAAYRAATDDELKELRKLDDSAGFEELLWSIIFCRGPLHRDRLAEIGDLPDETLDRALQQLRDAGRIQVEERGDGAWLSAERFLIQPGDQQGWEASVYDHFHAVVRTICNRLDPEQLEEEGGRFEDSVGGSTYTLDVGPGHPLEQEVLSTLGELREKCGDLRRRVSEHNQKHGYTPTGENVVVYVGQSVIPREEEDETNGGDSGQGEA